MSILVFLEHHENELQKGALGVLAKAASLGDSDVAAVVVGSDVKGLASEAEFEALRKALRVPLLANMTEFGKTPIIPLGRFRELGYNLVIFPMTAFRVMLRAIDDAYAELLASGTQAGLISKMRTRKELYELIEYDAYNALDNAWSERVERGSA